MLLLDKVLFRRGLRNLGLHYRRLVQFARPTKQPLRPYLPSTRDGFRGMERDRSDPLRFVEF